jgi:hypothetical protein
MLVVKAGLEKYCRERILFWDIIEKAEIIHITDRPESVYARSE